VAWNLGCTEDELNRGGAKHQIAERTPYIFLEAKIATFVASMTPDFAFEALQLGHLEKNIGLDP